MQPLTNDILTDCASACDSDSFVLGKSAVGWDEPQAAHM